MRGARDLAWLVPLCLLLAGCSETATDGQASTTGIVGSDGSTTTIEVPPEDVPAPSAGKGAIQGVLVDDGIRPIPGIVVSLTGGGVKLNTTTSAAGGFRFNDLDPGSYFVSATAANLTAVQTSVDVKAGEVATARLITTRIVVAKPYHETVQYRGHIDFWAGYGQFAAQVILGAFAPGTLPCTCEWNITAGPNAKTFVVEAFGTVGVADPTALVHSVYWEFTGDYLGENQDIRSGLTEFPFTVHIDRESFVDTDLWNVRITGGVWTSGPMDFDLYVTTFYAEPAPDGWTIEDQ